eukprot:ANDGO_04931.mRNA.1 hypothetical protein
MSCYNNSTVFWTSLEHSIDTGSNEISFLKTMIPPCCYVCHKTLRESSHGVSDFELIKFRESPEGKSFAEKSQQHPGFVGHNPDAVWFCREHAAAARDLQDQEWSSAKDKIPPHRSQ